MAMLLTINPPVVATNIGRAGWLPQPFEYFRDILLYKWYQKKTGKSTYDPNRYLMTLSNPNRYLMTLSDHTGYKWWRHFHRTTHECWLSVASWCQIRMDTEPLNWLLLAPRKTWNSLTNSSCSCWTIRRKPDPVDWNTKTIITFRFSVYLPKKQSRYAQSTINLDHALGTPWGSISFCMVPRDPLVGSSCKGRQRLQPFPPQARQSWRRWRRSPERLQR